MAEDFIIDASDDERITLSMRGQEWFLTKRVGRLTDKDRHVLRRIDGVLNDHANFIFNGLKLTHRYRRFTTRDGSEACADCYCPFEHKIHAVDQ